MPHPPVGQARQSPRPSPPLDHADVILTLRGPARIAHAAGEAPAEWSRGIGRDGAAAVRYRATDGSHLGVERPVGASTNGRAVQQPSSLSTSAVVHDSDLVRVAFAKFETDAPTVVQRHRRDRASIFAPAIQKVCAWNRGRAAQGSQAFRHGLIAPPIRLERV